MELLPCPWCGSKARSWPTGSGNSVLVCCDLECEQSQEHSCYGMLSEVWNTRATDARVQLLAKALKVARDDMESWQGYASDHMKEKWDAAGDLAKIDAALKEAGMES